MPTQIVEPLSGHAIFVLLLQLAGMLALARILADVMRRLGQPAVIGELLAGMLLGPTVLGHFSPELFQLAFPPVAAQMHLLEVVSWLGLVLLLLLTGLETDIRIVRGLGPAPLLASAGGMILLFAAGITLGYMLPDQYVVNVAERPLFAALLATALAISALPVIGKILIDLNLIKRDVGIIILSTGVIDDTVGWLVLGVIAGIAEAGTFSASRLLLTLAGLVGFVIVMRYAAYPLMRRMLAGIYSSTGVAGADLTLIVVGTLLCAAATEALGVHAVFGAFIFGIVLAQIPRIRQSTLHTLETFVLSVLSPIFFAFVGLKVNLWAVTSWQLPALIVAVAIVGKTLGCFVGARVGGLSGRMALAVGVGMNARGAMGLIVALIGLTLGLLTPEMFAIIVLMAIVTSFIAPVLLRLVTAGLPLTEQERRRLEDDARQRFIPAGPLRILVPTAGGGNAAGAFALAAPLAVKREGSIVALYIEPQRTGMRWRLRRLTDPSLALVGRGLDAHLERAAARLGDQRKRLTVRRVQAATPAQAVLDESTRGIDLLMVGASARHLTAHSLISDVLAAVKVPTLIVRAADGPIPESYRRLVVPVDGSQFSRYATEFAFAYAAAVDARLTLLHVVNEARVLTGALVAPESREAHAVEEPIERRIEGRIRADYGAIAAASDVAWDVRVLASGDPSGTILEETRSEHFDLLVLGAENKLIAQPLFFGQGTATIVERSAITTVVVVPPRTE